MYYYIFEPPLEAKEYERTAQIKEYLSTLGIAGEMVTPTQARTVEDLVNLAVAKRYSTVIAVGTMELINQVARALEPFDVVFGIIPTKDNPDITRLIGAATWKDAADQLKRRRWLPVRLGLLNGSLCFLTPATIFLADSTHFTLTCDDFTAQGSGGTITVSPLRGGELEESSLLVEITRKPRRRNLLGSLFGQRPEGPTESRFDLPSFELTTSDPAPVNVAGTDLCSTPVRCEPQEKAVKLIVAKAGEL